MSADDFGFEPDPTPSGDRDSGLSLNDLATGKRAPSPAVPQNDLGFEPDAPAPVYTVPTAEEADQARGGEAMKWLAENDKQAPERRAEVIRYAAASGLPHHMVDGNLDEVKRQVEAAKIDWQGLAKTQPALHRYLESMPQAVAMIRQSDVDNLKGLEWGLTGRWEAGGPGTSDLEDEINPAVGGVGGILDRDFMRTMAQQGQVQRTPPAPIAALQGAIVDQFTKVTGAKNALVGRFEWGEYPVAVTPWSSMTIPYPRLAPDPEVVADLKKQKESNPEHDYAAAVGADYSPARIAARAFLVPFRMGPMIAGQSAAMAGGAAVAGPGGAFAAGAAFNAEQNLGDVNDMLAEQAPDGKSTLGTRALALGASALGGVAMQAGVGPIVGKIVSPLSTLAKPFLADAGVAAVKQAVTNPSALKTIATLALSVGKHAAMGAAASAAQAGLNAAAVEGERALQGKDPDPFAIGKAVGDGFTGSLGDMLVLSAFGAGRAHLAERGMEHTVASEMIRYKQITDAAKDSKLLDTVPDEFKKIVNNTGAKIHIPAEDFVTYFQGQKIDPEKMAGDLLGDGGKALREAQATGGDIAIPAGDFLAKLGKTPHAEGLTQDVKLAPDSVTPKQKIRENDRISKQMEAEAKRRAPEIEEGKKRVREFIEKQAKAAKFAPDEAKAAAASVAEAAGTAAARTGVSVRQAAATMGLQNLRILGEKGAQVAQAVRDAFLSWVDAPDASHLIDAKLDSMDPEAIAQKLYLDPTGLRSARAEEMLGAPEGTRPAHVSVEGVKYLNDAKDSGGHEKANELYQLVAKAIHDVDPTAAKVGGDFAVHVKDQTHLDELLAKVNETTKAKGFEVTGALGKTLEAAGKAHEAIKADLEAAGKRAKSRPQDAQGNILPAEKPLGLTTPLEKLDLKSERAAGVVDPSLVNRVVTLKQQGRPGREQLFNEAFVEKGTGLLTREGWDAIPRKAAVASFDVKALRLANKLFGGETGDLLLKTFGEQAAHFGGSSFDFAHLSGDEYAAQHDDPEVLRGFVDKLTALLQDVRVDATSKDGEKVFVPIEFHHGIGGSYGEADLALNAAKSGKPKGTEADLLGRAREAPRRRGEVLDRSRGAEGQHFPGRGEARDQAGREGQHPQAERAWDFLRGDAGGVPDLEALVSKARDRLVAEGKGKVDPDLAKKIQAKQAEVERLAKKAGTRASSADLGGGNIRAVDLPAWLDPQEFRDHRAAWEWTRAAIEKGNERYGKAEPPEPIQRLIADYMEKGALGDPTAFDPENFDKAPEIDKWEIMKGFALARIWAGEGGQAMRGKRGALEKWANEPAATRAEQPIAEKDWGRVVDFAGFNKVVESNARGYQWDKKIDVVKRWLTETKHELSPDRPGYAERPPAMYGEKLTEAQATERETAPADATAKFEAKRAELDALNAEASKAATAGVKPKPKLDHEKVAEILGSKASLFKNATEKNGLDPNAVAKHLGFGSGEEMLNAMVAAREPSAPPVAHIEGGPVVLDQRPLKGNEGDPRGTIRLDVQGNRLAAADIINTLKSDKSTLAHETAHFLSWALHNIAGSDLATSAIRADYDALLKWAGFDSAEARINEHGTEAGRAKEEKISHGWEQYLLEGKSPSKKLVPVFNRFKGWLIGIYRGIAGVQGQYAKDYPGQKLELSDDVRGVFDRLLATDDAITEAKQKTAANEPNPEAMAKMTPEKRAEYLDLLKRSGQAIDEETTKRAIEILGDQVGPERDRIREEVAADLDKKPIYKATRLLQAGELSGDDGVVRSGKDLPDYMRGEDGKPLKLSRPDFVAKYGKDAAAAAPRGIFGKSKAGEKADAIAPLLGFDTGEDLAKSLQENEHRDVALAKGTQSRLDDLYGTAKQHLERVGVDAAHNDHELAARIEEHRAMAVDLDPTAARRVKLLDRQTLKAAAERIIDSTPVGDLDPAKYQRQERASLQRAAELRGKKDKAGQAAASEQRLANFALYIEARDRTEALDKAKARLERGADDVARARLGKADPAYRDVHDQILEAVGLAEPQQGQRGTVDALLASVTDDGGRLGFDVDGLKAFLADPKPWDDLTASQAQTVSDAAENIRTLARRQVEVDINGKRSTRAAKIEELKAAMVANRKPVAFPAPAQAGDPNISERAAHIARGVGAMLQDTKSWAVKIDGENIDGVGHGLLVDAFVGPRDKAVELTKKVLEPIVEAWKEMPKEIKTLRDKKIDLSEVLPLNEKTAGADRRDNRTRAHLWMLFMNWGNEGNRQRVRDGNGYTDQQVRKALDILEKPEVDFLQKVLDTVSNGVYDELAALHERDTGLKLGKVEASPIETRHGTYAGGYFPLKYDPRFSEQGGKQEIQTLKDLEPPAWARPSSKTGATIERVDQVKGAPVDMEWGVIGNHLAGVVHDIAYREAIRNVGSILLDKDFKSVANDYLGPEYTQAFLPWLQGVAANRADLMSKSVLGAELGGITRNVIAMGALGFNVSSVLAHSLDFSHAIAAGTRPEYISAGMAKVIGYRFGAGDGWDKMREAVLEASPELRYRDAARDGGFKKALADMEKAPNSIRRGIQTAAFKMHELSEITQETAVFLGRQAQELAAGKSTEEATKIADDVVRQLLPSQDIASKPPILRTKWGLGAVTMFYGYANKLYNLYLARPVDRTVQAYRNPATGDRVAATAALAGKLMAMAILGASTKWVRGAGRKKDDDESVAGFMTKQLALEPAGTVPLLGPIIDSFATGRKIDIRSAPEAEFAKGAAERLAAAYKHFSDGEESDAYEKFLSAAELAVDIGAGTHVGQASKTADYLKKAHSGEVEPRGAGDWIGGLLFGDHKGDPANPATAAQDLVSGK